MITNDINNKKEYEDNNLIYCTCLVLEMNGFEYYVESSIQNYGVEQVISIRPGATYKRLGTFYFDYSTDPNVYIEIFDGNVVTDEKFETLEEVEKIIERIPPIPKRD